jgi:hypothetical protein
MKRQKSCGPRLGKLVHQLPGVVTFAYDLRFRRVIARWKGIIEEIHFGGSIMPSAIIENLDLKKPSFRPSKWPRKLKPAKNSKLPKLPENYFEPVGKGGWTPISTWIRILPCSSLPPSLHKYLKLSFLESAFAFDILIWTTKTLYSHHSFLFIYSSKGHECDTLCTFVWTITPLHLT